MQIGDRKIFRRSGRCDGGKNTVVDYYIVRGFTEKRSLRERRPREEKKNINLDDHCAEKKEYYYYGRELKHALMRINRLLGSA